MNSPLNIEKSGAGDPLVLIHGLGSASNAFKPIRPSLDKDFMVVTVDLPGHGKSPYQKGELMDPESLALKILEQLSIESIENFNLAGNSLGGWIAMEMAAIAPDFGFCALKSIPSSFIAITTAGFIESAGAEPALLTSTQSPAKCWRYPAAI
ncbi:MAG: alpha/beta fold hydrolase [Actinobacteria bacterium]|nr:alpha/beta fold hydrolase [Actinomycetota bacterium]